MMMQWAEHAIIGASVGVTLASAMAFLYLLARWSMDTTYVPFGDELGPYVLFGALAAGVVGALCGVLLGRRERPE